MNGLEPLETLYDSARGDAISLPEEISSLYGVLRLRTHSDRPTIIANFVSTLDGVVSLGIPGHAGGGDISGFNQPDRMVMGILRAVADAVVVGAGTLRAVASQIWTADDIWPALAPAYHDVRSGLNLEGPPLNVFVTRTGEIDLAKRVFASAEVPVLIVTTRQGSERIRQAKVPPSVQVAEVADAGTISATAIIQAVTQLRRCRIILTEGGPHLLGDFLAAGRVDDLFLTVAPQVAGRDRTARRPGLVEGTSFAPDHALWSTLVSVKRAASHLFLQYAFDGSSLPAAPR